jgi:hypothetical protein
MMRVYFPCRSYDTWAFRPSERPGEAGKRRRQLRSNRNAPAASSVLESGSHRGPSFGTAELGDHTRKCVKDKRTIAHFFSGRPSSRIRSTRLPAPGGIGRIPTEVPTRPPLVGTDVWRGRERLGVPRFFLNPKKTARPDVRGLAAARASASRRMSRACQSPGENE